MARHYASLIGPLLGVYFPLPDELGDDNVKQRLALNSSRLKHMWCSILDDKTTNASIQRWGGHKLPDSYAKQLDYDHFAVFEKGNKNEQ